MHVKASLLRSRAHMIPLSTVFCRHWYFLWPFKKIQLLALDKVKKRVKRIFKNKREYSIRKSHEYLKLFMCKNQLFKSI